MNKIIKFILFKFSKKFFLNFIGLSFGNNCRFIGLQMSTFGSEPYLIKLGNHVTVGSGVKFITHDGGVWVFRERFPDLDLIAPISIGSNVFIGLNSIILPGAKVENNVVIGAGSVVNGLLKKNNVYAGIPAKKIKSLDEYRLNVKKNGVNTKRLKPNNKKKLIKNMFKNF